MKIFDLRIKNNCDIYLRQDVIPCFDYLVSLGRQKASWWIRIYFWFWKKFSPNKEIIFTEKDICQMLLRGLTDDVCKFFKKCGIYFEYRKIGNNMKLCGIVQ